MDTKMNQEVFYQCKICNYVIRPKKEDPKPAYCPNCALHNHKGQMVMVVESGDRRPGLKVKIFKK
jgi:rubredoxin